jgi:N-acetylglutamate synthase
VESPAVGTRVVVRYRLPAGSTPPLTDVIGHVVSTGPVLRVRTKRGEVVAVGADDVVAIKSLTEAPVRTADIRSLEHAAAFGWPGTEQRWVDGWVLRAAGGVTHRGNSAVPLGMEADASALPSIVEWYAERGLTAWLSLPDRLARLPGDLRSAGHLETVIMVCDVEGVEPQRDITLRGAPDVAWLRTYERDVPVEVLTAVIDGEVVFASISGAAVGRGAVTAAPDGTKWLGLSAVRVAAAQRRRGHARALCSALLDWGASHGATRCYAQVLTDNSAARELYTSMGFSVHHRSRYVRAE